MSIVGELLFSIQGRSEKIKDAQQMDLSEGFDKAKLIDADNLYKVFDLKYIKKNLIRN